MFELCRANDKKLNLVKKKYISILLSALYSEDMLHSQIRLPFNRSSLFVLSQIGLADQVQNEQITQLAVSRVKFGSKHGNSFAYLRVLHKSRTQKHASKLVYLDFPVLNIHIWANLERFYSSTQLQSVVHAFTKKSFEANNSSFDLNLSDHDNAHSIFQSKREITWKIEQLPLKFIQS